MMGIFMAIGIVYGDIGTSPLYVMKAIVNGLPAGLQTNPDYIIGAISCIIWTLTLQTTIKYVIVTLRADNRGEGGILSLFALIGKKYRWAYVIAIIGASTIISEAISLDLWPNIKIKYPTNIKGQMFIPQVNYALFQVCSRGANRS